MNYFTLFFLILFLTIGCRTAETLKSEIKDRCLSNGMIEDGVQCTSCGNECCSGSYHNSNGRNICGSNDGSSSGENSSDNEENEDNSQIEDFGCGSRVVDPTCYKE